ncbi:hypothetical protein EXIGLDRAFT_779015 [Exidia glandulosa HHB12029]|uniref:F-box domain-containing protein n=1 Tax=Exidia glandulosa HHB12029 TaxID=1314781 RepID=A0A165C9H6_EXIGL|nr:hypothetical protein EXIGLDRAFT_779015 [Exidia glandulosa HHB12029]
MRSPLTAVARRFRKAKQSLERSNDSNAASVAEQLPPEILLAIFAALRPRQIAWTSPGGCMSPDDFYAVGRHTLVSAARVCRAWYVAATAMLYRSVRLATAKRCIIFARTVMSRPQLAKVVRDVVLPQGRDTALLSLPLDRTRRGLQLRFSPAQRRLRAAVVAIVDSCTHATNFGLVLLISEEIFAAFQLDVLAPRVEKVSLSHQHLEAGSVPASPPELQFPNLEVLCLSTPYFATALPRRAMRAAFPVLRALFLSRTYVTTTDLCALLADLGPLLTTLSFYAVMIHGRAAIQGEWSSPLEFLDEIAIPTGSISALTELHVLTSFVYGPSRRLTNFRTGVSTLASLTISAALLNVMHVVPDSLEQLIVCRDIAHDYDEWDPLRTAANLKQRLPQFKLCAPRLCTVELRVRNALVASVGMWRIMSFLLHSFGRALEVDHIMSIHLNHPDVRQAMHRAELAKRGLPVTDERQFKYDFYLSQTSWDVSGCY